MNIYRLIAIVVLILPVLAIAKPKMPLEPTAKGVLTGIVVVLDVGHGGTDPGSKWVEEFNFGGKKKNVTFWEASYTYSATWQLAGLLRQRGAVVYLTTYSANCMGAKLPAAQSSLPLPRDATYYSSGAGVKSGSEGIDQRLEYCSYVWNKYLKRKEKVVFLSLHIDAMPEGWSGSHVIVRKGTRNNPTLLAKQLASRLSQNNYARKNGSKVVRPLDDSRSVRVLSKNPIPRAALLEMSTPVSSADSWRLRSSESRESYFKRVVIPSIAAVKS